MKLPLPETAQPVALEPLPLPVDTSDTPVSPVLPLNPNSVPAMAHPAFADDMREIVESFLVESRELFEALDHDLLELEQNPTNTALIDQIFRAVHTIKGTSGFLSLEQLSLLAHHFEDVLNRLRRGTIEIRPGMMDVMFAAFDQMKVLLHQIETRTMETLDLDALQQTLKSISEGRFEVAAVAAPAPPAPEVSPAPGVISPALEAVSPEPEPAVAPPEAVTHTATQKPTPARPEGNGNREEGVAETIRVEVKRLDALMDLVGELVLGRNRLMQLVSDLGARQNLDDLLAAFAETTTRVDFLTSELQGAVMQTRMVPVGRIFAKFPRLVRDLARDLGKQIELVVEGQETEVDKSIIEELGDPLLHLVRNACDHGVERPAERTACGKPAVGRVRLAATHEGNLIVITIEDDGGGLNLDRIKQKAIEKKLITPKEAQEMSEQEAYNLIFLPGFSTAQQVSQVSGRGVGMDVVKTNLSRLNGSIHITSKPGAGTCFTIKLPLTLAIIQSLLVRVGPETFALPLHAVSEVVNLRDETVQTIHGREVIRLREQVLPLLDVGIVLNVPFYNPHDPGLYAVIIQAGHHRLGLKVNALVGQKEIVIKPLGALLEKTRGIAGSTILGDGRVVTILDLTALVNLQSHQLRDATALRQAA